VKQIYAAVLVILALLAGCSTRPHVIIDGSEWNRADSRSGPVLIAAVNGKMLMRQQTQPLPPGTHYLHLWGMSRAAGNSGHREVPMLLMTKPCHRYFIAARYETALSARWEPVLLGTSPIPGCRDEEEEDGEQEPDLTQP
jgi:hypothetical protein